MKISQLKAFAQVYSSKSFSKAAEVLGISQPAVSQAVKSLEDELGTSLLTKGNGRISLTPAGDIVYDATKRILQDIDIMELHIKDLSRTRSLYRMNSSALAVQRELIPYMHENNADFTLQYEIVSESESIETLLSNQTDIITSQRYIDNDDVICKQVAQDGLNICVPLSSRFAKMPRLTLKDLEDEVIIFNKNYVGGSINDLILNTAADKNIRLRLVLQSDYMIYRQMQESSDYAFFTSDITKKYEKTIPGRVYIPLTDPEFTIKYYVSYLKKNAERLKPLTDIINKCFELSDDTF